MVNFQISYLKFFSTLVVLMLFIQASATLAQDDSEKYQFQPHVMEDPTLLEICKQVSDVEIPKADKPSLEQKEKLQKSECSSRNLYYGIGKKISPIKARHCAYMELEDGDQLVFGGSRVLMMIYANGIGVKKNLKLALKLACIEEAMAYAEVEYRLENITSRLNSQKQNKPTAGKFDYCDDAYSGYMDGHCTKVSFDLEQAKRDRKIRTIIKTWDANHKKAFKKLKKAAYNYFETSGDNEVDLSGTSRGRFIFEHQNGLQKNFLKTLKRFEKGEFPLFSKAEFIKVDKELNKVYNNIQRNKSYDEDHEFAAITREGIKKSEKAWIKFTMVWITLAKTKYPTLSEDSLKTFLWKNRIKLLKELE